MMRIRFRLISSAMLIVIGAFTCSAMNLYLLNEFQQEAEAVLSVPECPERQIVQPPCP